MNTRARHWRFLCLLQVLVISGCTSLKPPELPAKFAGDYTPITNYLSALINQQMKKGKLTGVSIALVVGDQKVWSEGFGYADVNEKLAATSNTVYRAGSVSKLFNAVAIMQLVEQEKLDLDAPITQYVDDFSINSRFGSIDDITLRSLLSHQSGMPSDIVGDMWAEQPPSLDSLLKNWESSYVVLPANKHFNYSNTGISLSGLAVQRVTGSPYSAYLKNALLDPLNMASSDFTGKLPDSNQTKGYIGKREIDELPLRDTPAGGLNTTVNDLSQFLIALHGNGKYKNKKILSESLLKQTFAAQNEDNLIDLNLRVGLGWFLSNRKLGGRYDVIGHDGRTVAHSAKLVSAPEAGLSVVLLSNSADNSDALGKIAREAMSLLYKTKGLPLLNSEAYNVVDQLKTSDNLTGNYAGPFNLIEIKPDGERFKASALDMKVSLRREQDNWFLIKVIVGGFTIQPNDLKSFRVTRARIDGVDRLIGSNEGQPFLLGDFIEPYPANATWDERLGEYTLLNPLEIDEFNIKAIHLKRHRDFYYVEIIEPNNRVVKNPIRPIDPDAFIFLGTGRGIGETVVFDINREKPVFSYSGLDFMRK
ncbi:MAG: serine hydrolase domain-containing protein [Granulosicoccus sp.]